MHRLTRISPNRPTLPGLARHAGVLVLTAAAALLAMGSPAAAAGTAPATTPPVLRYLADGGEQVDGTLEAGRPVLVDYDAARLPLCRNQYAGGDAWSISVYYRVDGGPVQSQPVVRLDENRHNVKAVVSVDLPAGGRDLELWFHSGDRAGCSEYDSRNGANYHYAVGQPAVATFAADWSETVTGELRAGRDLVIRYDAARLPQCRETYNSSPAWRIDAFYRFDGGPAQSAAVTDAIGRSVPATVALPSGTHRVEFWFRVIGQLSGCVAYDSDYGANYAFAVA
ncbi:hypothetical protein GCM10010168_48210 [Actinoplanes ianthinogenes]|uniref:Uncharacterized protein n=1 Tax=Actinoplanes ianthinogenes TaxID=122358 RepID=A0ABM7LNP1_9ACTN|nr:DUF6209 family protein [Actinoplanes ianthinogenes]BCJ40879.1 hypothetical protein Aiant_15360 [Actinoplanes ianthinogenes]GGR24537.1 hypothetical protein GCM10010168_48210 [Actinoplanes ianthinogenes]